MKEQTELSASTRLELDETIDAYNYAVRHKIPFEYLCGDEIKRFDWEFLTFETEVTNKYEKAAHQFIVQAYRVFPGDTLQEEAWNLSHKLDDWKEYSRELMEEMALDEKSVAFEGVNLSLEDVHDYAHSRFNDAMVNLDVRGMNEDFQHLVHANAMFWLRVSSVAYAAIKMEGEQQGSAA